MLTIDRQGGCWAYSLGHRTSQQFPGKLMWRVASSIFRADTPHFQFFVAGWTGADYPEHLLKKRR